MWRLLCLSIISAGCSDGSPSCGPHGAGDSIAVTAGGATLTFGMLVDSANADCGVTNGIVSITISGSQTDQSMAGPTFITMCVPRPDHLGAGLTLNTDFNLQDVTGSSGSCTYAIDHTAQPTGTAKSAGLCDNGKSGAGFALTIDAQFMEQRTCGAVVDSVPATLSGTVAVAGP
jgi:hypothetical protein